MNTTLESLVRNLAVSVEGLRSTVEGHSTRLDETRADAREARDATTKLTERLTTQNVPAQIGELRADFQAGIKDVKLDLINAMDKSTQEYRGYHLDVDARLKALEDWREQFKGATGLAGWLSRNAPWLVTIAAVVASYLGLLPHK